MGSKQGTKLNSDIQAHFNPFVKDIDVDEKSLLTQRGYDDMGNGWVSAITKYMNPNGDLTSIPTVLKLDIPSAKRNEILVTYSKPISDVTAVKMSNYQVIETSGMISINNAIINEEKRVVKLLTTSLNEFRGKKISLKIINIVDRVGNSMNDFTKTVSVPNED